MKSDFRDLTGFGIKVALIDSGVDTSYPAIKRCIVGGTSITMNKKGVLEFSDDFKDLNGHGTACASIILSKAPNIKLFPIKIFDKVLSANGEHLVQAIETAIREEVHIINLSLGSVKKEWKKKIYEKCLQAKKLGISIISATHKNGLECYPANLPGVLAVGAGRIYEKYSYVWCSDHRLLARGDAQRLKWINSQEMFLGGSSFATPHITGIAALLRENNKKRDMELETLLKRYSLKCGGAANYKCYRLPPISYTFNSDNEIVNNDVSRSYGQDIVDKIKLEVIAVIEETLKLREHHRKQICRHGILTMGDKFGVTPSSLSALINALERRFDIRLSDDELRLELFNSVNDMSDLIISKQILR